MDDFQDLDGDPDDDSGFSANFPTPSEPEDDTGEIEPVWGTDEPNDDGDGDEPADEHQDDNPQETAAQPEDEDDISSYGKRVQKRIQRERAVTAREREARQAVELENAQLRAELQRVNRENDEVTDAQVEAAIAAKMERYKTIRAEFDPEKGEEEAQLLLEIAELRQQKGQRQQAPAQQFDRQRPPAPQQPPANPRADAWIQRNSSWYGQNGYEHLTSAAETIDKKLYAEGYDPTSAEYFAELDRRLNQSVKLPNREQPQRRQQPSVAPVDRGGATRPSNRVVLTREDRNFMLQVKLNPNNPDDVKAYAAEKLRLERGSRR